MKNEGGRQVGRQEMKQDVNEVVERGEMQEVGSGRLHKIKDQGSKRHKIKNQGSKRHKIKNQGGRRRIWQETWGFPESIVICCGIVVAGFLIQLTTGFFDFYLLARPVNLILGGVLITLCVGSAFLRGGFMRWFAGVPMAVSLIFSLLIHSIIMGLTPQAVNPADAGGANVFMRLGFNGMTSSWPFVLIYLTVLFSLGSLIARKLRRFDPKRYAFYLSHIGLWLVLFAAGLGYADMERYVMYVREGEVEWRVWTDDDTVKELPIAIQLNDFDMDEYPPQLTVIDRRSGLPQPESKPDFFQLDPKNPHGRLDRWDIRLEQYIHRAVRNSDSTYREVPMPGSSPAALITAVDRLDGHEVTGWVSSGNSAQLYMALPLNENRSMVMTMPEPKSFSSDIEVFRPDKQPRKAVLEVNKPMRTGSWTIYQYDYDHQAGRLSSYSGLELVYDPWAIPVYAGFALIALGAAAMIWNGRPSRKIRNDNGLE